MLLAAAAQMPRLEVAGARRRGLRVVIDDDDILTPTPPPLTQSAASGTAAPRLPSVIFTSVFSHRLPLPPLPPLPPVAPAPSGGATWRGVIHGEEDQLYNATPTQSSASASQSQRHVDMSQCAPLTQPSPTSSSVIPSSEPISDAQVPTIEEHVNAFAVSPILDTPASNVTPSPACALTADVLAVHCDGLHSSPLEDGKMETEELANSGERREQSVHPVTSTVASVEPPVTPVRRRKRTSATRPCALTSPPCTPGSPMLPATQSASQRRSSRCRRGDVDVRMVHVAGHGAAPHELRHVHARAWQQARREHRVPGLQRDTPGACGPRRAQSASIAGDAGNSRVDFVPHSPFLFPDAFDLAAVGSVVGFELERLSSTVGAQRRERSSVFPIVSRLHDHCDPDAGWSSYDDSPCHHEYERGGSPDGAEVGNREDDIAGSSS